MSADELIKLEATMQQNMVLVGFKIHERQRQMKDEVNSLTNAQAVLGYVLAGRKTVKECIMSCFTTPAILEMPATTSGVYMNLLNFTSATTTAT